MFKTLSTEKALVQNYFKSLLFNNVENKALTPQNNLDLQEMVQKCKFDRL